MSQAIGEVLAFGLGVALSPAAVVAMVLMLVAPGGRVSASVFVASWALSLGAVATLALLVADGANARHDGAPADWVIAVQIGLAVLLLLLAAWQWRGRGDGEAEPELPAWMRKVDGRRGSGSWGVAVAGSRPGISRSLGETAAVAISVLPPSARRDRCAASVSPTGGS